MSAVKLFEGIPPIIANVTRLKRDTNSTSGDVTAKPIELFVEVGNNVVDVSINIKLI